MPRAINEAKIFFMVNLFGIVNVYKDVPTGVNFNNDLLKMNNDLAKGKALNKLVVLFYEERYAGTSNIWCSKNFAVDFCKKNTAVQCIFIRCMS